MQRTRLPDGRRIPDAINCTISSNFTQVPNDMLRNPELSAKAKGVLCLLLSNKKGEWVSYISVITDMMKDGETAIRSGITELEKSGYLIRLRYREKSTKKYRGMVWCYTDCPNNFNLENAYLLLEEYDLEPVSKKNEKPIYRKPRNGFSRNGEPPSNNTNINNTNINKNNNKENFELGDVSTPKEKHITPSMFNEFWEIYPRKVDKGKAKTKWEQICNKSPKDRPTWKELKSAILRQKKSERWQDAKFIPHPTTWLNQRRWLDDPAEMKAYNKQNSGTTPQLKSQQSPQKIIQDHFQQSEILRKAFLNSCYKPAARLFGLNGTSQNPKLTKSELAQSLIHLNSQIEEMQSKKLPGQLRHLFPGSVDLVSEYLSWIDQSSWVTDLKVNMLDINHGLFTRFRREQAKADNHERDPLTGTSYMRE